MKRIYLIFVFLFVHTSYSYSQEIFSYPFHYSPEGMYFWDSWYLVRGDTVHVFHLQLKRPGSERPDKDHGSVGHAISTDMIHWKELPVALHSGDSNAEKPYDDGTLFTGSAVEYEGMIYNFYCGNTTANFGENNPTGRQSMCLATSGDGLNFKKYKNNPVIEPPLERYYNVFEAKAPFQHHARDWVDCRDMLVIRDPFGDGWLGYNVMRMQGKKDAEHSICIVLCRSDDLYHWEVGEPVATPNRFNCFEVPDVFELDGKWYMIALTGDVYGQKQRWSDPDITCATIVFESTSPYGPFIEVKDNLLLASKNNKWQGFSARTVNRNGERLMLYTHTENSPPHGRLSWPVKLIPAKEKGLLPVYWEGRNKIFAKNSVAIPKTILKKDANGIFPLVYPGNATGSGDSVYMFQTEVNSLGEAGISFGASLNKKIKNYQVLLSPSKDGKGEIILKENDSLVLTSRNWKITPGKNIKLRIVVVKEVIEIYIDNILAIDYFIRDLIPGDLYFQAGARTLFENSYYHFTPKDSIRRVRNDPEAKIRLHYRPDDGYFGDAIPFFWDSTYHVFYLKLPKGNNNVQWEHISSRDLVHWKIHPTAIPEYSLTGSVIERENVFHAFYTGSKGISRAFSKDLTNWELDESNPVIPMDTTRYSGGAWRDPHVFWNPEEKCYWMLICAHNPSHGEHPFTGSLALAKSNDLLDWEVFSPLWSPNFSTVIECPDIFKYDNKWVLFYYWHETRIRVAESPAGPWKRPKIEAPDSFGFCSGKTMFDGNRRIMIGWMMRFMHDCAEGTWGGNMLLPREWYLLRDGTPATKVPEEILDAYTEDPTKGAGAEVFIPSKSKWQISADRLYTNPGTGGSSLLVWENAPADYLLSTKIGFSDDAGVKILLRGNPGTYQTHIDNAYALEMDPVQGKILLYEEYHWNQRITLKSMRYDFQEGKPVLIELFMNGDILEVFVDKQRSLVHRLLKYPHGSLGFLVSDSAVSFEDFKIRTLPETAIFPLP